MHGARHVFRRADARKRRGGEDARALLVGNCPSSGQAIDPGDADAHAGRGSSASERVIAARPGLGDAVERVALSGRSADVDDVDDRAVVLRELGAACCAMKSGARRFDR